MRKAENLSSLLLVFRRETHEAAINKAKSLIKFDQNTGQRWRLADTGRCSPKSVRQTVNRTVGRTIIAGCPASSRGLRCSSSTSPNNPEASHLREPIEHEAMKISKIL